MLTVENLEVWYSKVKALWDVSLEVHKGEIVGLIGPNGAGKTTTLNTIMGLIKPRSGKILLNGERIDGKETHEIIKRGLFIVPEGRRLFPFLTVEENLLLGSIHGVAWEARHESLNFVYTIFPRLKERRKQLAGTLSGGEQQMLTIARALMSRPNLLLIDEPSLGLAPKLVIDIYNVIKSLRDKHNTTILLADQNARRVLEVCDRAYVIENGRIVMEGAPEELKRDKRVKEVYLGL
ncbi:MAG: ABC transporter ATP-binding protein [Candidatus Nezhaarchaeota archaeon]|nr:ABC transporter ATP-binding protein [Candidatus Nezhaarchaeota archaeon]MCX8142580.1 ABC transporter ATP-binding protein [Candidatus Nezhaarchaeota archaeon]